MDKTNNKELLQFILESISLIKKRFDGILSSDDFLASDDGLMRLDAISMRLQSIGEALKNIDKRDRDFLLEIADKTYWSNIIKTREIITHHYIDIDSETIFMICDEKLDDLENKISILLNKLQ
ncbi:HepT-like ribonuclease domain-containing protein [Aliarcobacter butzleri]|uniref:HepT-like ribonuclease domain-containing protein n=1 Tax=Aliarcobacter butzleri TaxID=28197 RepID=UPI00125F8517|nr:HepT-like ribonuclease domain-containing protein [Aliarcobacter butzleri]